MSNKLCFEAFDKSLKDIMGNDNFACQKFSHKFYKWFLEVLGMKLSILQ